MGVPKFYRWISERYPCLSETVQEYQIPEFDNLYLDMNGIIHICSHPNDDDPHFRISEEQIFKDIFHYIEVLFRMIQPRDIFFMAVDGVAPRAKMNQQRGRRFRSAREAEDNEKKALAKGEVLPSEERFDSNCITPGTEFMTRLDEQLQYFVVSKISTDALWHNCKVIYSGHKTPGEGEHKIMEFIRYTKSQPNYNAYTRHCLYGLDADLIMLGLTSHEIHFSLLREEVRFGKKNASKRTPTPEETTFHLLHLSLMRQYIGYEFMEIKNLPFEYNLDSIIDDWVLMGFLVGNDFIPHLPTLHINKDALPILYEIYKEVLPTLDGYLNEGGQLNLKRFEKFMLKFTEYDREKFSEVNDNMKYLRSKSSSRHEVEERAKNLEEFSFDDTNDAFGALEGDLTKDDIANTFSRLGIQEYDLDEFGSLEDLSEESTFDEEFRQHKRHYYISKMEFKEVGPQVLRDQAANYVRGLQWILNYYYNGICSWSWYYPYHYAPYISDVKDFADVDMSFSKGTPFLPFEQLLAVLPPNSIKLLPSAYHDLLLSNDSPLKDFYPKTFETDRNGKQQDWEAVVLIPFIDERKLLREMDLCHEYLSADERARNSHGAMHVFKYTPESLGEYKAPGNFPAICRNYAASTLVWRDEWDIHPSELVKGLLPGVKLEVFFAGFPSFRHLDHTVRKEKEGVKVFQQVSRGDNVILEICAKPISSIENEANFCIGRSVFVQWPHLVEAKLTALSDGHRKAVFEEGGGIKWFDEESSSKEIFHIQRRELTTRLHTRWGVDIKDTKILALVKPLSGRKYVSTSNGRITLEKEWFHIEQAYPYQMLVYDLAVHDPGHKQYFTLDEFYPPGSKIFMLGQPYYGAIGEVIDTNASNNGRVRVTMLPHPEPNLDVVLYQHTAERYVPGFEASSRLSISSHLFARITGTILLAQAVEMQPFQDDNFRNKINIGMNLKNNKKNEEVIGFTRKCLERKTWLYSEKCVKAVGHYQANFPEIFLYLHKATGSKDIFCQDDIFPTDYKERVPELVKYLKDAEFTSCERCTCGSTFLDNGAVSKISEEIDKVRSLRTRTLRMQVKPHLLFKPNQHQGSSPPDTTVTYRLLDRVVNVREGFSVPLGARGTVTGIHPGEKSSDNLYDVMFDEPFPGGLKIHGPESSSRCYRLHWAALINLSHGNRTNPGAASTTAMSGGPQQQQQQQQFVDYAGQLRKNVSKSSHNGGPSNRFPSSQPSSQTFTDTAKMNDSSVQTTTSVSSPVNFSQTYPTATTVHHPTPSHGHPQPFHEPKEDYNCPRITAASEPPDATLLPNPIFKRENSPRNLTSSPTKQTNHSGIREILSENDIPFILHGNYFYNWNYIKTNGLTSEKGNYIPCVSYIPPSIGARSYQLHIYLDVSKLLQDGIRLICLAEGQVLCSTADRGFIPRYYFKKVVDMQSGKIIFPRQTPSSPLLPQPQSLLPLMSPPQPQPLMNEFWGSPSEGGSSFGRGRIVVAKNDPIHALKLHENIWAQLQNAEERNVHFPSHGKRFPFAEAGQPPHYPSREGLPSTGMNTVAQEQKIFYPSQEAKSGFSRFVPTQVIRKQTTPRKSASETPPTTPKEQIPQNAVEAKEDKTLNPKAEEVKKTKPKKVIKSRLAVNFDSFKNTTD